MNRQDKAVSYFKEKFNCSQSVLSSFSKDYGISENELLKISCAFGGGMGRQQHTCGAVTGALMVLGLEYGKAMGDPDSKKDETYEKTREFFSLFINRHGSTNCRDLLEGLDMNDPEDYRRITEENLFELRCEQYVSDAVKMLEAVMRK